MDHLSILAHYLTQHGDQDPGAGSPRQVPGHEADRLACLERAAAARAAGSAAREAEAGSPPEPSFGRWAQWRPWPGGRAHGGRGDVLPTRGGTRRPGGPGKRVPSRGVPG